MPLFLKQLGEEGAGCTGAQNEDPHGVRKLYHTSPHSPLAIARCAREAYTIFDSDLRGPKGEAT
jgi:hypothetical protein